MCSALFTQDYDRGVLLEATESGPGGPQHCRLKCSASLNIPDSTLQLVTEALVNYTKDAVYLRRAVA